MKAISIFLSLLTKIRSAIIFIANTFILISRSIIFTANTLTSAFKSIIFSKAAFYIIKRA